MKFEMYYILRIFFEARCPIVAHTICRHLGWKLSKTADVPGKFWAHKTLSNRSSGSGCKMEMDLALKKMRSLGTEPIKARFELVQYEETFKT